MYSNIQADILDETIDWWYVKKEYKNTKLYKNYQDIINKLIDYEVFTDIEFNPKKSINCQARTCAILVSLVKLNLLDKAMSSKKNFIEIVYPKKPIQKTLF
jgi:hypothetical protein